MANVNYPTANSQKVVDLWNDDVATADEGNFFVATNPTVGTGITGTICVDDAATGSSTHAQFAPYIIIYNSASPAAQNSPSIYMRYIREYVKTAPASATNWACSFRMDNLNRYLSGGSVITPVNVNPGSPKVGSIALVYAGALVPTALPSATARLVSAGLITGGIPIVGDQYNLKFGNGQISMDSINNGAGTKNITYSGPPIVIPPGWCMAFDQWGTSNAATAIVAEFEMGWVERVSGL